MPIETGTTIASLDSSWPLSGDFVSEGDDHITLIKRVLKNIFPGLNEQGFDTPILANEAELNFSQGARANLQAQIDNIEIGTSNNLGAPPGTTMIFFDAAPPAGWTQLAANQDSMLRVVSGQGGGVGGSSSPTSHDHQTGGHVLTTSEIPSHRHVMFEESEASGNDIPGSAERVAAASSASGGANAYEMHSSVGGASSGVTAYFGAGASHSHGNTGITSPRYINVITAVKD